ncbi:glycosyltransferase family 2 protein [Pseudovibrio exalbescens]|uniref:glycosyltransferase family 2 protein n=1 Tax=Pseudovibrio exalbescens TaxID=197461 RepID=UPI002367360C|nr:glycosyltransferase family 2 protein [Pseudovibrio exalbescens]MDD7912093.1 glycosyltransferase family 2 protein [Pseudovibrio exalbescens]
MSNKLPVSVFIIACNEADRIGTCIQSVADWVDEVIVIDSGSDDETVTVAEQHGAQVIYNPWPGYGLQKRFGEDKCRNSWILNLDADEAISPALRDEIKGLFASGNIARFDFWRVDIKDVWAHEQRPAAHAYSHRQIRLYRVDAGRFSASSVHDTVRPPEGVSLGLLKHCVEHRSIRSIAFQVEKMNRYSNAQVKDLRSSGRRLQKLRLFTEMPMAFFKAYFLRGYWRYGWWGIVSSMTYAFSRFLRIAKAYEAELLAETGAHHDNIQLRSSGNRPHSGPKRRSHSGANARKLENADISEI